MPKPVNVINSTLDRSNNIHKMIESNEHDYAKVAVCDIDGVFRGKKLIKDKIYKGIEQGIGFSDVILGWDIKDTLYEVSNESSRKTGYGDVPLKIDPTSCRINPLDNNSLLFLGELGGHLENICPRTLLKRIINYASDLGYKADVACEFEFVVFDETLDSIRNKKYKNLKPISQSVQAYSLFDTTVLNDFLSEIVDVSSIMKFPVEGIHPESGAGVYEAALLHTDTLSAADGAALFKMMVKLIAQKHQKVATFMPKISEDLPGQGGHIHISLKDLCGKSIFYDENTPDKISPCFQQFIAGIQQLLPEVMCMCVPTVNGFKRLVPDSWAPINKEWGIENRTCGLRIIGDSPQSMHLEFRISGADINPYIAISAVLAAGVWGIKNKVLPREPVVGNAYILDSTDNILPKSLEEATSIFKASVITKELFGELFVERYAFSREWEVKKYANHVSDWELDRYFEVI